MKIEDQILAAYPKLNNFSRSLLKGHADAPDLVHNAIIKMMVKGGSFEEGTDFSKWASRILYREFLDYLRKNKRNLLKISAQPNIGNVDPIQEDRMTARELIERIYDLPWVQRVVVVETAKETRQDEIANNLNIPQGTVRSRLNRARKDLAA